MRDAIGPQRCAATAKGVLPQCCQCCHSAAKRLNQSIEIAPPPKIRDGSAERNERPRGAAVFDFRFRARYEPQLLLQSVYATRPDLI